MLVGEGNHPHTPPTRRPTSPNRSPGPAGLEGRGLLLVQNCTQTRNESELPHLPEPTHGWDGVLEEFSIGFRPAEAVSVAASMFPRLEPEPHAPGVDKRAMTNGAPVRARRLIDAETGEIVGEGFKRYTLTISGGLLKVVVNDIRSGNPTEPDGIVDGSDISDDPALRVFDPVDIDEDDPDSANVVDGFSRRSRNRCRAAGASLDWAGAKRPGTILLMVTLTYPGDWRACAPTPDHVLRHRRAFEMRFQRAAGYPVAAMWKREFQERGAPHLHLFGWFPSRVAGVHLTDWVSSAWFEVVKSGDPLHLLAGTGVDYKQTLRMTDPSRVGNYFASYATEKGYKDYQNHAPPDWTNPNGSVGRYWGYVGLERLGVDVAISETDMIQIERILRGVLAAQKRTHRTRFSTKGARPDGMRRRMVNKRYRLSTLKGTGSGFMFLTNDGAALAARIAGALDGGSDESR